MTTGRRDDGTTVDVVSAVDVVSEVDVVISEDIPADAGAADAAVVMDVPAAEDGAPGPPQEPVEGFEPPPPPTTELGFMPPERELEGEPPSEAEVTEFTRKLTDFYKETHYFDWVYRVTHGLDASYDPAMMPYKLWWQGEGMRREGDRVIFDHRNYAENIAKRTIKVIDGAIAGHLLTEDERMAEVAAELMRGMVALALAFDTERDEPKNKYLQARAVFTHDHSYEVDGRQVSVEYDGTHETRGKWNVHVFEIPDNPEYGSTWVNNMRSKDDVPYMYHTLFLATRAWYESDNESLRDAALLYIEYMRGFAQSIVNDDWFILTRYEDGVATGQVDTTKEGSPAADCGSFVHWQDIFGPDAECTGQLGAALAGYGFPFEKGDCDHGEAGHLFEEMAGANNWFNHNIYNYFHIAALSVANLWGHTEISESLMEGLVRRLVRMRTDSTVPNNDHDEFESDSAGWLLTAASQGYPLNAREARHIMKWYGDSAEWYIPWEHWDPWSSLEEGERLDSFKPPRKVTVQDAEGDEYSKAHIRIVEMAYPFEYCASQLKAPNGVSLLDCELLADPSRW